MALTINTTISTTTRDFTGLDFGVPEIQEACNICYAEHIAGNHQLTAECYACGEFTPKLIEKEAPFLDFALVAITLFIAFLFFKLTFKTIWTD
jgi:hypothetical protein